MRFDIMTLFPDMVDYVLSQSIIGRAQQNNLIQIKSHNIRDYSKDKHHRVDDTPYGGGMGMLMMAPPIYDCYQAIREHYPSEPKNTRTIYLSPKGPKFTQEKAFQLSKYDHIILLCGHYEGIDQRVLDEIVDEELSVGDYVLTGGEIPACIVVDATCRLIDGVLSDEICYQEESIAGGMLEYPQYTRPYEYHGVKVPDVLISGHHANIEAWRKEQSLVLTEKMRPDLLKNGNLSPKTEPRC